MILRKGDACIQCREHKVKCNGLKPICSRCHRLRKECAYPAGRARRRPLVELLEARALQLQLQVNKVALSSSHDFSIASVRLGERIRLLGDMSGQIRTPANAAWLPIYPAFGDEERDTMQSQKNDVTGNVIERFIVERRLASFTWTTGEELPSSMSQYLIRLFLPYRLQHYFFMDVSHFLHCLALPLDHPESIHPCLRHACHLAACNVIGGRFALLEPYFIDRTRYFLHQSLMFVDRVPHFLWASLLLGYCLAKKRRLEESYVIFTAACQLATACGLYEHADHRAPPSTPLLPPPRNPIEAMDRIWLVHSLYLGDQALSAISAFPGSFVVERIWESTLGDSPKEFSSYKVPVMTENESSNFWQSDVHSRVSVMQIFQKVHRFSRSVAENGYRGHEKAYASLRDQIAAHDGTLSPPSDSDAPQRTEGARGFNPHLLLSRATLYGSALILHSSLAREHPEARNQMLKYTQELVTIFRELQEHQRLHSIQSSLVSLLHAMNASRIIARELQTSQAQGNARLSTQYCLSIEALLDFMDTVTIIYSAWTDAPLALKDTLISATSWLQIQDG